MKSENNTKNLQQVDGLFIDEIKQIVRSARQKAYTAINFAQVEANWLIGRRVVQQEQAGNDRAEYGKNIIRIVAQALTQEFGNGFSVTNVKNFKKFYLLFNTETKGQTLSDLFTDAKSQTMSDLLSWSHYERLIRVENEQARAWYIKEAATCNWTVRTLDRNIGTMYYERLLLSQIKEPVQEEMLAKISALQQDKFEFIKNPSVLEFLNLPVNMGYTEAELEKALIDNIQKFILELGKGFAFVERQQLIRTETKDYHIDLVFYNYLLKCFVLIDLKTEPITHQDVGQMDMYVRMYDELKKSGDDNPTLGIVLCTETDHDIARYSILKGNEQIFATKYKLYLPSEEELRAEIEREKMILKFQFGKG
ncbi:MAG: PDDEXK nuclease domain-containing protein [Bacteroidota bacterium]